MTLRFRLRELREARRLTQQELAELSGVDRASLSDFERGYSRMIALDTLDRLCKALGVPVGDLFTDAPLPVRRRSRSTRGGGRK